MAPARRKKTRAELEAELRLLRRSRAAEGLASVVNNVVRIGGLVAIAHYGYKTVEILAGQFTVADIAVRFITDLNINQWLAYAVGVGGVGYGWGQRRLRKKTVERLHPRIAELEKRVDNKRSTSRLTPTGDTHPEDKI